MPLPVIKAVTKLTEDQWRVLLRRLLKQEGGKLTPKAAEQIMAHEPPMTKRLGTLYPTEGAEDQMFHRPLRMPIEEARAKYFENPEAYDPGGWAPPAKHLSQVPMGSPEDLAAGISYSRNQFEPIISSSLAKTRAIMGKEEAMAGAENTLGQMGMTPGDISIPPKQFLAQEGVELSKKEGDIKKALEAAIQAEQIWKEMGGARTTAGQLWQRMRDQQSGGVKKAFDNGREWFVASYNKFVRNPQEFTSKHPKEASLMERIMQEYKGGGGGEVGEIGGLE